MMDRETLKCLLKEHEGELFVHEDDNYSIKVSYSSGALPMFSKLEVFILDRSKFSVVNGRVKATQEELQASFEAYQFRNFIPLLELVSMAGDEIPSDTLEETEENIKNGIYSFVRLKDGKAEMLVVSVGNPIQRKGVFYYPEVRYLNQETEAVALIELEEDGVKIYKNNLEKVPEL